MLMRLLLAIVVFGIVAVMIGSMTAPEVGQGNPRVKILAAISVAKQHRAALDKACARLVLRPEVSLAYLGLGSPESYAGNFRSRVDIDVESATTALVTVHLKSLGQQVPKNAWVRYTGTCKSTQMSWQRTSSPDVLLPTREVAATRNLNQ
jgi:hypothetical protein